MGWMSNCLGGLYNEVGWNEIVLYSEVGWDNVSNPSPWYP